LDTNIVSFPLIVVYHQFEFIVDEGGKAYFAIDLIAITISDSISLLHLQGLEHLDH